MNMDNKPPPKPPQAAPKPTAALPPKPAAAPPKLPTWGPPVLETPQHPFEEFMAKEFAGLVERMNKEGERLGLHPIVRLKVLVTMLTIRVAAFSVRGAIERVDILKVLDQFIALQPKPPSGK